MDIEPLDVYSRESNYAIVKPPGRNFPGCVIQGDSLANLCRMAKNIATAIRDNRASGEDFLESVQELNNALVGRILHYQRVLANNGIGLPYTRPLTEEDMVTLLTDDNEATDDQA